MSKQSPVGSAALGWSQSSDLLSPLDHCKMNRGVDGKDEEVNGKTVVRYGRNSYMASDSPGM